MSDSSASFSEKARALAKMFFLSAALTIPLLLVWLGLTYWFNRSADAVDAVSSELVLNYMLVTLLAFVGLPVFHRGLSRWFFHLDSKRPGSLEARAPFGSTPTAPVPRTRLTWRIRALYIALYAAGVGLIMFAYGPLGHQLGLIEFIGRYSAGRTSFQTLATFFVGTAPAFGLLAIMMWALEKDVAAVQAGRFDAVETLRRKVHHNWLFAYAAALPSVSLLCFFVGLMIHKYLM